jgi:hypothetical protein
MQQCGDRDGDAVPFCCVKGERISADPVSDETVAHLASIR